MKVRISKMFDFDAAHWLPKVSKNHKCHRLHGHTYRVEVFAFGPPDKRGMVCDYAELAELWWPIHELLDHRCLNEVDGLTNPTTELLAPWILRRMARHARELRVPLEGVRVYESATTWCEAFV